MATTLPDAFKLPAYTAALINIDGEGLTARDVAYILAVGCMAASGHAEFDGVRYLVHDHGLRAALGRTRSDTVDVELKRHERLQATTVISADLGLTSAAPTLPHLRLLSGVELPLRTKSAAGSLAWDVPAELIRVLTPSTSEPNIVLPMRLLANARNRHTVMLAMRVLAWLEEVNRRWVVTRKPHLLTIRVPLDELIERLAMDPETPPSRIFARIIEPAAAEISEFTDLHIDVAGVYAGARAGSSRMKAIELRITHPVEKPAAPTTTSAITLARQARFNAPKKKLPRPTLASAASTSTVTPFRRPN